MAAFDKDELARLKYLSTSDICEWICTLHIRGGKSTHTTITDAFTTYGVDSTELDKLIQDDSRSGIELRKYGIDSHMHCAKIAKEWRDKRLVDSWAISDEQLDAAEEASKSSSREEDAATEADDLGEDGWMTRVMMTFRSEQAVDAADGMNYLQDELQDERMAVVLEEGQEVGGCVGEGGGGGQDTSPSPSRSKSRPPSRELSKSNGMREMARAEVVETEQGYMRNLMLIEDMFHNPMVAWMKRSAPGGDEDRISQEEMDVLFGQIPQLLQLSRDLYSELMDAYQNERFLGAVFMKFGPFFRLYAAYVTTYEAIGQVLEDLEKRPSAAAFIAACELQPAAKGTSLRRFLSLPLLRVPQYKLLLREVLKHTKTGHAARVELERALELIDSVAHKVNSSIATHQRHMRESSLRDEWQWDGLNDAARQLVKEGDLVKLHKAGGSTEHRVLLFNDMLVYGEEAKGPFVKKGQIYKVKRTILLTGYVVVDIDSHSDGAAAGASNTNVSSDLVHDDLSWTLVGPDKIVTFKTTSHEERVKWVSTVQKVLQDLSEHTGGHDMYSTPHSGDRPSSSRFSLSSLRDRSNSAASGSARSINTNSSSAGGVAAAGESKTIAL